MPTPRPADPEPDAEASTYIAGKDLPLEQTIANMSGLLAGLGIKIEIASWRNIVPNVWSLHIRDAHSPMCFTNGKGSTKESALASALGEYIERMNNNHFYAGAVLGRRHRQCALRALPGRALVQAGPGDALPKGNPRRILPGGLQPRRTNCAART
jgi:ribosomal protein S12 methylthiotransferase accessory factor